MAALFVAMVSSSVARVAVPNIPVQGCQVSISSLLLQHPVSVVWLESGAVWFEREIETSRQGTLVLRQQQLMLS